MSGTPAERRMSAILADIILERGRQDALRDAGKFAKTLADTDAARGGPLSPCECLTVCSEEFGEVAEIVADAIGKPSEALDREHLREELIQLAACCVAWVEQLDTPPARTESVARAVRPVVEDPDGDALAQKLGIPSYAEVPSYIPRAATPGYATFDVAKFEERREAAAREYRAAAMGYAGEFGNHPNDLLPDYGGAL